MYKIRKFEPKNAHACVPLSLQICDLRNLFAERSPLATFSKECFVHVSEDFVIQLLGLSR